MSRTRNHRVESCVSPKTNFRRAFARQQSSFATPNWGQHTWNWDVKSPSNWYCYWYQAQDQDQRSKLLLVRQQQKIIIQITIFEQSLLSSSSSGCDLRLFAICEPKVRSSSLKVASHVIFGQFRPQQQATTTADGRSSQSASRLSNCALGECDESWNWIIRIRFLRASRNYLSSVLICCCCCDSNFTKSTGMQIDLHAF